MYEARDAARPTTFEERRMWRLLLARLHPDSGGHHDLFAFACAVRDEVYREKHLMESTGTESGARNSAEVATFLGTWHEAMGRWSSSNRDALNRF